MPWREVGKLESRMLFVKALECGRWSFSEVCRRFGISRKTGYKWYGRYVEDGLSGLENHSRRPGRIVYATDPEVMEALIEQREAHPHWGARKLCKVLERKGITPPPERTANRILKRAGLVACREKTKVDLTRFERRAPNELWQIDHKKAIHGRWARRCVPFVVLDDHSRYLVGLEALTDKGLSSTWEAMWGFLGRWGLPDAVLSDNDSVFHGGNGPSQFEVRLMRLGVKVLHGRPYHPETQGKVERFNGTLERELLRDGHFKSAVEVQQEFDRFRHTYNFERPHESLCMDVPASRYEPSRRRRPDKLPEMEYASGTVVRKVDKDGWVRWQGRMLNAGRGLFGQWVEVREGEEALEVYFGVHRITAVEYEQLRCSRGKRASGAGSTGGEVASGYALRAFSTSQDV